MGLRRHRFLGALLLAGIAVALPRPAGAYVRTLSESGKHLYWNRTSITLIVHTLNPPPPLTSEQVMRAARAAAAAWSRESLGCSPIDLTVVESQTEEGPVKADREFHVMIKKSNWCPPGRKLCSANQLALTTATNSTLDGRIVDMDVEVNATGLHKFADIGDDPSAHGEFHDLQGVLTHEFGHVMGFGHSCVADQDAPYEPPGSDEMGVSPERCTTRSSVESVMLPAASELRPVSRRLSDDDRRGVCNVYPALPREVEGSLGGCSVSRGPGSGGGAVPLLAVAMVIAMSARLARRRRCGRRPGSGRMVAAVLGAAVGLTGQVGTASAYVRTKTQAGQPAYWNHPVLSLTVHTGTPPTGLTSEQIVNATEAAAASWSRAAVTCAQVDIDVRSATGAEALSRADGVANVIFRRDEWCRKPRPAGAPCYDPGMLALTSVFMRKSDGRILDADIEVNAVSTRWSDSAPASDAPEGAVVAQDLQGALTHELGHLLGFEHSCLLPGEAPRQDDKGRPSPACTLLEDPRQTVMVASVPPGQPLPRALAAEDTRALCEVYPALANVIPGDHAGCTLSGSPPASSGGVLVLAALLALTARATRT